jgi:hypothetical protein
MFILYHRGKNKSTSLSEKVVKHGGFTGLEPRLGTHKFNREVEKVLRHLLNTPHFVLIRVMRKLP